jgi:hypothetical protein
MALDGDGQMPAAAGFGWHQIEVPVAEPADGVSDQRGDGGQIVRVDAALLLCA